MEQPIDKTDKLLTNEEIMQVFEQEQIEMSVDDTELDQLMRLAACRWKNRAKDDAFFYDTKVERDFELKKSGGQRHVVSPEYAMFKLAQTAIITRTLMNAYAERLGERVVELKRAEDELVAAKALLATPIYVSIILRTVNDTIAEIKCDRPITCYVTTRPWLLGNKEAYLEALGEHQELPLFANEIAPNVPQIALNPA